MAASMPLLAASELYSTPSKVQETFKLSDDLVAFKTSAPTKLRARSIGGSSTASGSDEDTASLSSPASATEATSDSEGESVVVTTVFPVVLLLQLGASLLHQSASKANALGYRAQRVSTPAPVAAEKATSWIAQRRLGREESNDEVVAKKARSILNKLTVEKFEGLYEQLAACGIRTTAHLRRLMHEIFEKATDQHHFISMYADVCVRLEADPRLKLEEAGSGDFKALLLDACQTAFEELLEARATSDLDEEAQVRRKQRALGNVKLVAQLMVRGMLSPRLLIQCAEFLLKARHTCAEALESLATLLQVAAPTFDEPDWVHAAQLDAVFWRVTELSRDPGVSSRERFLLRDVLERRELCWSPASPASPAGAAGPMKLKEVLRQRERELAPAAAARWEPPPPPVPRQRAPPPSARVPPVVASSPAAASSPVAEAEAPRVVAVQPFSPIAFRRVLAGVMKELSQGWNVPAAVRRVREQGVPLNQQSGEFADILTRAAEEPRGPARRSAFAFAAGLAAADGTSAFDREACLEGTRLFFSEVVEDLGDEVPRLAAILKAELLPTLRSVLPESKLRSLTPPEMWVH